MPAVYLKQWWELTFVTSRSVGRGLCTKLATAFFI